VLFEGFYKVETTGQLSRFFLRRGIFRDGSARHSKAG
jgi:hypothetical protein